MHCGDDRARGHSRVRECSRRLRPAELARQGCEDSPAQAEEGAVDYARVQPGIPGIEERNRATDEANDARVDAGSRPEGMRSHATVVRPLVAVPREGRQAAPPSVPARALACVLVLGEQGRPRQVARGQAPVDDAARDGEGDVPHDRERTIRDARPSEVTPDDPRRGGGLEDGRPVGIDLPRPHLCVRGQSAREGAAAAPGFEYEPGGAGDPDHAVDHRVIDEEILREFASIASARHRLPSGRGRSEAGPANGGSVWPAAR